MSAFGAKAARFTSAHYLTSATGHLREKFGNRREDVPTRPASSDHGRLIVEWLTLYLRAMFYKARAA